MSFVLALDQGTTSSRAIVFDHAGAIRAVAQREFAQVYPRPGWVEHDPMEIWATQSGVMAEALAKAGIAPSRTSRRIGITNQRETTILWERATRQAGRERDRLAGSAHGAAIATRCAKRATRR